MTRLAVVLALLPLLVGCAADDRPPPATDAPVVAAPSERPDRPWLPAHVARTTQGLDLGGLLPWPVESRRDGVRAVLLGSDGATLFPFERVARHRGGEWQTFDVERGDAMPYASGAIVLPDGRLLTLLDHWSNDRGFDRPGPQHHGLWVSTGIDWSRYTPYRGVRFRDLLAD